MDWYEQVPKDYRTNLAYRLAIVRDAAADPAAQAEFTAACAADVLFYLNTFCVTYDPRLPEKVIPFVSYPYQDTAIRRIIECVYTQRDLVVEKSRDMGASWMCLYAMEWLYHFHPANSFLLLSRKESLVDKPGDPDTLFSKLDLVHRHLPDWLRPRQNRTKLAFENRDNGSTINGDSTTSAAGVGGRRTAVFVDEFSRMEDAEEILQGTADVTGCRIFNFTPYGTSTASYRLAMRTDVAKLRLHWSDHPVKAAGLYRAKPGTSSPQYLDPAYRPPADYAYVRDEKLRSPWYDGECARRANPREVAMMLDIDYAGSQYRYFDAGVIRRLQEEFCRPAEWEGDVEFDRVTARPTGLVRRSGGPLRMWVKPLDPLGRVKPAPYAAGSDIALGTGATPSTWSCIDASTGEKVAEYASPFVRPDQFAAICCALGWWFLDENRMPVMFAWEMNGPGVTFAKHLIEYGYRRFYYRSTEERLSVKASDAPGWYPGKDQKLSLLEQYREGLATRRVINRSYEALAECLGYVFQNDGSIEHCNWAHGGSSLATPDPSGARSNHGDRVIADALAYKMMMPLEVKPEPAEETAEESIVTLAGRILAAESARRSAGDGWVRV